MRLVVIVVLLFVLASSLTFQPAHIIRDSTLDETRLTVIVPLSERCPDIRGIAYCFSRDVPMDHTQGCATPHYQPIALQRSKALVDDAKAIRFVVPYWEGRNALNQFYNPVIYVEVRDSRARLMATCRLHVDPPSVDSLLTTEEQIEALAPKQGHPESPRSVMWIGISLFVVAAGMVVFALLYWRRPTTRKSRPDSLEGAILKADEADWYHKM